MAITIEEVFNAMAGLLSEVQRLKQKVEALKRSDIKKLKGGDIVKNGSESLKKANRLRKKI